MDTLPLRARLAFRTPRPRSLLTRWTRSAVLGRLQGLGSGRLTILEGGEEHRFGGALEPGAVEATIRVHDAYFWTEIALGGHIGAGESYARGEWSTPDLTELVRLLVQNRHVLESLDHGVARLASPLRKVVHALHRNSRSGSRRNISVHYDLGNEFFRLWLDRSRMYSSALYESPDQSLEDAQQAKLRRLCEKLELGPDDHLLEIGTGWGEMARYAARHHGCRVTTTTISRQQYEAAVEGVRAEGLQDLVEVRLDDYRDLDGTYDKLVSVEMIEAVGAGYLDEYVSRCSQLLKPHGLMAIQAITIQDQLYDEVVGRVDFIQKYIFPGSFIPCHSTILDATKRKTDLRLVHLEDFGPHYARTLAEWNRRFQLERETILAQGFSEEFMRLWEFYLSYCEGGFEERQIGVSQLLFAKPECRRAPYGFSG